jgi:hypothetical protein
MGATDAEIEQLLQKLKTLGKTPAPDYKAEMEEAIARKRQDIEERRKKLEGAEQLEARKAS